MGSMRTFLSILAERPVLFDGAIGTELYRRGVFLTSNFEELCLSRRSLVLEVHRDYHRAGAEVMTTNSYGANRFRLEHFGLAGKVAEINRTAAALAREAAGPGVWVAGSLGPTGLDPASFLGAGAAKVEETFAEQIQALVEGGVDLILCETFGQLAEMQIVLRVAKRVAGGLPLLATMRFETNERLPDHSPPEAVAEALKGWGADVIGVNCGDGPGLAFRVAEKMLGHGLPVMAQPNAGTPEELEGRTIYVANPEYFGVFGRRMLKAGIRIVGGCCGTTPDHIRRMRGAVRMMGGAIRVARDPADAGGPVALAEQETAELSDAAAAAARASGAGGAGAASGAGGARGAAGDGGAAVSVRDIETSRMPRAPLAQHSELARKIAAGKFVVSVEVNPEPGMDPGKPLAAARMLRDAGIDVINIADGPRATVRMSNLSLALLVQREVQMEVLLHVCCRDRNLLALQADILGAHVLGIRNLVIITGDPPKVGDYPDATAVYDLDSVGLLKWVDGYNHGVDPAGKEMSEPTRFWVATGFEPAALDYDREVRRLEQKVANGADFVMTQPVYDPKLVERFLTDIAHVQRPVLLGLLPLASWRNAEFLNAEVPGIVIPEQTRTRMKAAGSGPSARAEGVKIAQEMLLAARGRVQGAYIMPPLGRYEMAPQILECMGEAWKRWPLDAGGDGGAGGGPVQAVRPT
jgi:methionine synthase I (cobalamin-dependent)